MQHQLTELKKLQKNGNETETEKFVNYQYLCTYVPHTNLADNARSLDQSRIC